MIHPAPAPSSATRRGLLSLNADVIGLIMNQLSVKDLRALALTSTEAAAQVKAAAPALDITAWGGAMTELATLPPSAYWCKPLPFCKEHACSFAAAHGNLEMLKRLRGEGFPWECRTTAYTHLRGLTLRR